MSLDDITDLREQYQQALFLAMSLKTPKLRMFWWTKAEAVALVLAVAGVAL